MCLVKVNNGTTIKDGEKVRVLIPMQFGGGSITGTYQVGKYALRVTDLEKPGKTWDLDLSIFLLLFNCECVFEDRPSYTLGVALADKEKRKDLFNFIKSSRQEFINLSYLQLSSKQLLKQRQAILKKLHIPDCKSESINITAYNLHFENGLPETDEVDLDIDALLPFPLRIVGYQTADKNYASYPGMYSGYSYKGHKNAAKSITAVVHEYTCTEALSMQVKQIMGHYKGAFTSHGAEMRPLDYFDKLKWHRHALLGTSCLSSR